MSGSSSRASIPTCSLGSNASIAEAKLRVSLDSGETVAIDIPRQIGRWDQLTADPGFQPRIRGLLFVLSGHSYVLCAPRGFRRVLYTVELIPDRNPVPDQNVAPAAIRASYVADAVKGSMTLYLKGLPPLVRFDLRLTGKLRWQAP